MESEKKKVIGVRKSLKGSTYLLALSSTGCGLNKKSEPVVDSNVSIKKPGDIIDELDNIINEFGAELDEIPNGIKEEVDEKTTEDDKDSDKDNILVDHQSVIDKNIFIDESDEIEEKSPVEGDSVILNTDVYQDNSIVNPSRAEYDSSYSEKKELATKLDIENYLGNDEQKTLNNKDKIENNDNISKEQEETSETYQSGEQISDEVKFEEPNEANLAYVVSEPIYDEIVEQIIQNMQLKEQVEKDVIPEEKISDEEKVFSQL